MDTMADGSRIPTGLGEQTGQAGSAYNRAEEPLRLPVRFGNYIDTSSYRMAAGGEAQVRSRPCRILI